MLTDDSRHSRYSTNPGLQERIPILGPNGERIFYEFDDGPTIRELITEKREWVTDRIRNLGAGLGRVALLVRGVAGAALNREGALPTMESGDESNISSQPDAPRVAEGNLSAATGGVESGAEASRDRAPRRRGFEQADSVDTEHQKTKQDTRTTRRTLGDWFQEPKPNPEPELLDTDDWFVKTPTVILDPPPVRPRSTPIRTTERVAGPQPAPANQRKPEPVLPAYIQPAKEREWEDGFREHTFEQIVAHWQDSRKGQTVESDWRVVWSTAKRLFLGATALLTDPPAPELTFEQKQEQCLKAYQEVLNTLAARRAHLESEVDLVHSFIEKMSSGLMYNGRDEVVKADSGFTAFVREVVIDRLDLRRHQPTDPLRSTLHVTKADLANFLGNTDELREYGVGLTAAHKMAVRAAIARAGVYATHDEQVAMEHELNERYIA